MTRTIAVASGKGGVGKTVITVTLAHVLARRGVRTLVVDGDVGLANVDVQLGITGAPDLRSWLAGAPVSAVVLHHADTGIDFLLGRAGSAALAAFADSDVGPFALGLRELARGYDVTLVDVGAGVHRSVRRLVANADEVLVVTADEPTALTDAYALIKLTLGAERPGAIIVNFAADPVHGAATYDTLARTCREFLGFTPAHAGTIRRDRRVRDAIRNQSALLTRHPAADATRDIARLADRIAPG